MAEEYLKLDTIPHNKWPVELHEMVLDIEAKRGAMTSPAIGKETIEVIQQWVKIENARRSNIIEGNNTTYADIEKGLAGKLPRDKVRKYRVIENTNHYNAEGFIDSSLGAITEGTKITEGLIRETHKMLMDGIPLEADGVEHPGGYREKPVFINHSEHIPPNFKDVPALMHELVEFCAKTDRVHYLINAAVAHHRFAWIHPFENGNGRAARLFSYSMLKEGGFHFNGMVSLPLSLIHI